MRMITCAGCQEKRPYFLFSGKSSLCQSCQRLASAREAVTRAEAALAEATRRKRAAVSALDAVRDQVRREREREEMIRNRFESGRMAQAGERV